MLKCAFKSSTHMCLLNRKGICWKTFNECVIVKHLSPPNWQKCVDPLWQQPPASIGQVFLPLSIKEFVLYYSHLLYRNTFYGNPSLVYLNFSPLKSSYILPSISANRHFEYQIVRTANWTFPKRKLPNFWQMYFMPNINVLKFHPILPLQSHSNWNWNIKWTIELWN